MITVLVFLAGVVLGAVIESEIEWRDSVEWQQKYIESQNQVERLEKILGGEV